MKQAMLVLILTLIYSHYSFAQSVTCNSLFSEVINTVQFDAIILPLKSLIGNPIKTTRPNDLSLNEREALFYKVMSLSNRNGDIKALREATSESLSHLEGYGFVFKEIKLKSLNSKNHPLEAQMVINLIAKHDGLIDLKLSLVFGDYKMFESIDGSPIESIQEKVGSKISNYLRQNVRKDGETAPPTSNIISGTFMSFDIFHIKDAEYVAKILELVASTLKDEDLLD